MNNIAAVTILILILIFATLIVYVFIGSILCGIIHKDEADFVIIFLWPIVIVCLVLFFIPWNVIENGLKIGCGIEKKFKRWKNE